MIHTYFDNEFMKDAEKAFGREYLLTNGIGAYCASTIGGCNTRKYHGLLVAGQPQIDDNDHVIVSAFDEQIIYKQNVHQIATHKYPNTIYPAGYKNIADFFASSVPKWIYDLDGCVLVKEIMMPENEQAVLIRYTVIDATEKLNLNLTPLLAFRNVHELKTANLVANKKVHSISNGIRAHLYTEYSSVYIQTSQKAEFTIAPDWYYNIEYPMEQGRGYSYSEDLFVPGHLSINLKKGDKLVVHIGLEECNSKGLSHRYSSLLKKMPLLNTEIDCLSNGAKQFIIKSDHEIKVKAGYYWFGTWGRDTFISLPGLLLTTGHHKEFTEVIKSSLADFKHGLFPNTGKGKTASYNSVDASLWFIWAIQQYAIYTNKHEHIWHEYGKYLNDVLEHYMNGTHYNIKMESDGLISAGQEGMALTWMDAVVNGEPVTPRRGKAVEINALWYNAVCFCIEVAKLAGDNIFTGKWENYPDLISQSFMETFWEKDKQYLADCVCDSIVDWSVRPNQLFALSMPHSPVPEYLKGSILNIVKEELLTPKGLRTLSPNDKSYIGKCEGDQATRDRAYHQGTVWPWLLGHFAQACINISGFEGFLVVEQIYNDCQTMLGDQCLFTIPEIYNGDAPHKPVGAVAQAWSVAEFLRIDYLLTKFKEKEEVFQTGVI